MFSAGYPTVGTPQGPEVGPGDVVVRGRLPVVRTGRSCRVVSGQADSSRTRSPVSKVMITDPSGSTVTRKSCGLLAAMLARAAAARSAACGSVGMRGGSGDWGWGYSVVLMLICSRYQVPLLPLLAWEAVF